MFATDRDLLILEPNLVRDIGWVGQRLVKGTGDITGNTLTMTGQDVGFELAEIGPGHVVTVGGVVYEVIETIDNTRLTISRMRASTAGAVLPPSAATGAQVEVMSFRPQLAMVHAQVLRMLGIDPDAGPELGAVTEEAITNPASLALFEALGALHLVFTAAAALAGESSPAAFKARMYRDRFAAERGRVAARIDTDADGLPDTTRRPSVVQLTRS